MHDQALVIGRKFMRIDAKHGEHIGHLEATAYHEAGHAVVAFQFHLRVKSVTIIPDAERATSGSCSHAQGFGPSIEYERSDRNRLRIERAVMCSLAGLEAQRKYRSSSVRNYHAQSDYAKAADLASAL